MIIDDLYIKGVAASPDKADTPLLVDADTVLAFSFAVQSLQVVRRRSVRSIDRLSMRSLRKAIRCISFGNLREKARLNTFSVSAHLKDLITAKY